MYYFVCMLVLGLLWGSFLEWFVHRYFLHMFATYRKFQFHLDHHRYVINEQGKDHDYDVVFWRSPARQKELLGLLVLSLLHLPMAFFVPGFYVGNLIFMIAYYVIHRAAHLNPKWGCRWTPWHMEHHMVNASKNYGIVTPLFDWLFGTLITRKLKL